MSQKLQLSFQTNNLPLATTLAMCGVPFLRGQDGKVMPYFRQYTFDLLRSQGYTGDAWDAAQKAWKNNLPGFVKYNFVRDERCEQALQIWDKTQKMLSELDGTGTEGISGGVQVPVAFDVVAVICCQFAHNRNHLAADWRHAVPFLEIPGESHQTNEGGRIVTIGSFKGISLNASERMRSKIGI